MEKRSPLVSIIVLNYKGREHLIRCIDSLKKQAYPHYEVIVVDNGSTDGSVDVAMRQFGDSVKFILNGKNLGFAEGNNIGIRHAAGDYIATLNNDTIVDDRWLEGLVSVAEKDDSIGMCASKILFLEKPDTIDSVGMNIYPDGMSKQRGHLEVDAGQYGKIEEILLPSACAALYRRSMLDEIGIFDKDFFMYCDDTDIGLRARLAGWKSVLAPGSIVYHIYSGTAGRYSPAKAYLVERNHYWVALKLFPLPLLMVLPLYTLLRFAVQACDLFGPSRKVPAIRGEVDKKRIIVAVLKAHLSLLISLPAVIKKRRRIMSAKKIPDSEIYALFRKFRLAPGELCINRQRAWERGRGKKR